MHTIIENNGVKLHTEYLPNLGRPAIIFLHGGPGLPTDFSNIFYSLKAEYYCVTFHQRGTHLSPLDIIEYSIDSYMSDIEAVINYFRFEKVHIFGHSWGGLLAQIYANKHPNRILSMFLSNPISGTGQDFQSNINDILKHFISNTNFFMFKKLKWDMNLTMKGCNKAFKILVLNALNILDANKDSVINHKKSKIKLKAEPFLHTVREAMNHEKLPELISNEFKVTIIYGENDIFGESMLSMFRRYKYFNAKTIRFSGHFPWIQNMNDFNLILRTHFTKSTYRTIEMAI